jgi:hypothetical protein
MYCSMYLLNIIFHLILKIAYELEIGISYILYLTEMKQDVLKKTGSVYS